MGAKDSFSISKLFQYDSSTVHSDLHPRFQYRHCKRPSPLQESGCKPSLQSVLQDVPDHRWNMRIFVF